MIITKAVKVRLYPNKEQQEKIDTSINCCRFVYNHMLSRNEKIYKRRGEHLSYYDMQNLLPTMKDYLSWLKRADSQSLKYVCRQVNNAYDNFFKKQARFPKYKSKRNSLQSYTTTNMRRFKTQDKKVKLPCLGWVKCSKIRLLPNEHVICYCTISKNNNKYYCSVTYKYEKDIVSVPINEKQVIGLDYKSDGLYVDSNGNKPVYDKWYRKSQATLAKRQRQLSKKQGSRKGEEKSSRWLKQHAIICKLQTHIGNQRKDKLHKLSYELANAYNAICIENLNMKAISNSKFGNGKATMDNGYGMFTSFLDYKLLERGKMLIKVDKFYPSTQLCSRCGCIKKIPLYERTYRCEECGMVIDRDINAAINIKNEGLRLLGV